MAIFPSAVRHTVRPPGICLEAVAGGGRRGYGSAMARMRPGTADTVLALVLAVLAGLEVTLMEVGGPPEARLTAATVTTLPLAWRSLAPVPVTIVVTGGLALGIALGTPPDDALIPAVAPLLAVYSVGAQAGLIGTAVAVACALAQLAAAIAVHGAPATELGVYVVAMAIALVVGRAVREMGFEADVLTARAAELERERDQRAQAAVQAERARIARELHDVIGHSISVMGVQAGAVRRLLAPEQEREREALLAVERTGRDAVGEMRRLLGILRDDGEHVERDALPTVRRVDDLVADLRRAGLDVELRVDGDLDDLQPGRALAAFRILQEALTNVLKHAPGAHVEAVLRRTGGELAIDVVDSGGTRPAAADTGGGHGLVGMRERVALYGGTLEAGRNGGGFAVHARLPIQGS
jgi:signal transduction histidine kinase